MRMRGARRLVGVCGPALVLCGAALFLFSGALFRGETFPSRDLEAYYRPEKSLIVPLSRLSGGLPLWNPLVATGQPFAGNPHTELFHPATTLFFLLPFEWAFRLQVILPPFVAVGAMFFLLQTLGRSRVAAFFGGLVWGFGGFTLSTTNLLPILFAVASLPAVLAFAVRAARTRSARDAAGLALSFGVTCLTGEPSSLLQTSALVVAALLAAGPAGDRGVRGATAPVGAGLVLGAFIGAAALVPGLHHAPKTARAGGVPEAAAGLWSAPPIRIAEWILPSALGHLERSDHRWYWGHALYPGRDFPFYDSFYQGLLTALLAFASLFFAPFRRSSRVWLGVAGAGALLAVGPRLPVWRVARRLVPFLSGLRYPEKFVLLVVFATVVLASAGFDGVLLGRRAASRRVALALFGASLAAVLSIGALRSAASEGSVFWIRHGADAAIAGQMTTTLTGDLLRLALLAATNGGLVLAFMGGLRRWAAAGLVAVAAADLASWGRHIVFTTPIEAVATPPPFLAPLVRTPVDGTLFHFAAYDQRRRDARGLAAPPVPAQWGIATTLDLDFVLTELAWSARATGYVSAAVDKDPGLLGPLLARRGAAALLRFRKTADPNLTDTRVNGTESPLELVFVRDRKPFAFCAPRVVRLRREADWVETVLRLGPAAADTACIDLSEGEIPEPPSPGRVKILERTPVFLRFAVEADGPNPSVLAVNQTWDEGWRARLDGRAIRLLRTDVSLSAALVPPGPHVVEMEYHDPWVSLGVGLSLAALTASLALVLRAPRSREAGLTPGPPP